VIVVKPKLHCSHARVLGLERRQVEHDGQMVFCDASFGWRKSPEIGEPGVEKEPAGAQDQKRDRASDHHSCVGRCDECVRLPEPEQQKGRTERDRQGSEEAQPPHTLMPDAATDRHLLPPLAKLGEFAAQWLIVWLGATGRFKLLDGLGQVIKAREDMCTAHSGMHF
jgi:hypothetical protein